MLISRAIQFEKEDVILAKDALETASIRVGLPTSILGWYSPSTNRYTTIPNHTGDMPEGTLRAILNQANITPEEFLDNA